MHWLILARIGWYLPELVDTNQYCRVSVSIRWSTVAEHNVSLFRFCEEFRPVYEGSPWSRWWHLYFTIFCLIVTCVEEYWWVWWSTVAGLWGQPLVWAEVTMVVLRHQCSEFRVSATHTVHSAHSSFMLAHCAMKLSTYKLYSYSLHQDWTMSNNDVFFFSS